MSKEGCKNIDSQTINEIGIPSIVLMENAANGIKDYLRDKNNFLIVCGIGNNGGDGLALARKLKNIGKKVNIIIVGSLENGSKDFKINLDICENLNLPIININKENFNETINKNILNEKIKNSDFLIDSIFGVGLNRKIEGIYKEVIEIINKSEIFTISIDIPSGIDSNSGEVLNVAIKANTTFTIEVMKKGFFNTNAIEYLGDIKVVPIDIPKEIKDKNSEKMYILSKKFYKNLVPIRNKIGNKGTYGKGLIMAGSLEYTGAAFITCESAIRTGMGLVTMLIPKEVESILKSKTIEAMIRGYESIKDIKELDKYNVVGLGPGIGKSKLSAEILEFILKNTKCNLVIDADALNIISEKRELLKYIKGRSILTPHPGEMERLTGEKISYIENNRIDVAKKFAKENNIILLLKGYNTVISDGEFTYVNPTGNSKMASGGMGDCLTGIITSLLGQGLEIKEAALLGTYIHGYIGDKLSKKQYTINARDIIKELPKTLQELCEN